MPENLWGILHLSQSARRKASVDADQVELQAMKNGTAPFQSSIYDDMIADSLPDDYPVPDPILVGAADDPAAVDVRDRIATQDTRKDTAVGQSVDELKRRAGLLGDRYPFVLDEAGLAYRSSSTLIYEYCLAVTRSPSLTTGDYKQLPRAFERLVGHAVRLWLGEDATSYRTGWPPDEDRPNTFKETIQQLAVNSGEWTWQPRNGLYEEPRSGDGGMDLVVWRRPADYRTGGITLLGQCACGNDWEEKYKDLDVDDLKKKYCRLPPAGESRFFATPHHVSHPKTWEDASIGAGIVFDRVRLALIAEEEANREAIASAARTPYEDLIRIVVPTFSRLPSN
jgi:hypothetical protein